MSVVWLLLTFSLIFNNLYTSETFALIVTGPFNPVFWLLSLDLVSDFFTGC